jgi:hypothetical protein
MKETKQKLLPRIEEWLKQRNIYGVSHGKLLAMRFGTMSSTFHHSHNAPLDLFTMERLVRIFCEETGTTWNASLANDIYKWMRAGLPAINGYQKSEVVRGILRIETDCDLNLVLSPERNQQIPAEFVNPRGIYRTPGQVAVVTVTFADELRSVQEIDLRAAHADIVAEFRKPLPGVPQSEVAA